MTLKEQEKLFIQALSTELSVDSMTGVLIHYRHLKNHVIVRKELEKMEKETEEKQEVSQKHIEQSIDYLNRKEKKEK